LHLICENSIIRVDDLGELLSVFLWLSLVYRQIKQALFHSHRDSLDQHLALLVFLLESVVFSLDLGLFGEFQHKLAKSKLHKLKSFSIERIFLLNHGFVTAPVNEAFFNNCHLFIVFLYN
jgi:hypothetical protein